MIKSKGKNLKMKFIVLMKWGIVTEVNVRFRQLKFNLFSGLFHLSFCLHVNGKKRAPGNKVGWHSFFGWSHEGKVPLFPFFFWGGGWILVAAALLWPFCQQQFNWVSKWGAFVFIISSDISSNCARSCVFFLSVTCTRWTAFVNELRILFQALLFLCFGTSRFNINPPSLPFLFFHWFLLPASLHCHVGLMTGLPIDLPATKAVSILEVTANSGRFWIPLNHLTSLHWYSVANDNINNLHNNPTYNNCNNYVIIIIVITFYFMIISISW